MGLAKLFLYLFIIIKPFYLLESGSFQLGDLCLVLSAIDVVFYNMKRENRKKFLSIVHKDDWLFLIFVVMVFLINSCYYVVYRDLHFLLSSFYFVYIAIGIVLFRLFVQDNQFLNKLVVYFRIDIYIQFLMLFAGLGRYRFEHRWCGTFNDPNQMAFFLMMCLFFCFLLQEMRGIHSAWELFDWGIGIFLLILSKSVGIALGFSVFGMTYIFWRCYSLVRQRKNGFQQSKKSKKYFLLGASIIILLCLVAYRELKTRDEFNIFVRIFLKLKTLLNGGFLNMLEERGINRVWMFPFPLIYGAGDGAFKRYAEFGYMQSEIHSTLLGIWYCYGVLPFGIVCYWIYKNICHLPLVAYIVYFALICESMFLVNYRQPFFWMIFVLGWSWKEKTRHQKNEKTTLPSDKMAERKGSL